jgi:predicted alpha/beta-fold hydrolase
MMLCTMSACASIDELPPDYPAAMPLPVTVMRAFCYRPAPIVAESTLSKEEKSYRIYDVSLAASLGEFDDDSPITFEYYEQIDNELSPVVLLLPILNGQKNLMRPFATHFARNGYAAIIVDTVQRKTLLDDLINPEQAIRQTVMRHRRVIDWVESRPELDISKLAVFGASLGGFNALFLAAFDERVSVVSPALVGGSLPYVLVNSNERRIEEAVTGVKTELSLNDEQLLHYLEQNIKTDTLSVAPHVNADRVLMVLARFDKAVPYDSQVQLRTAIGYPEAITLPTGHITAAAYLFYLRSRVLKFFDRKLAENNTGGTATVLAGSCENRVPAR